MMLQGIALSALIGLALGSSRVTAQDSAADAKNAKEAATASAAAPTVPQFRGGTLGIPGTSGRGVLALVSGQTNTESFNANVFARVGRLELAPRVALDVVGETFTTTAPGTSFVPGKGRPLMTLARVTLTSLGMRLRLHSREPKGLRDDVVLTCFQDLRRAGLAKKKQQLEISERKFVDQHCPNAADTQCTTLNQEKLREKQDYESALESVAGCRGIVDLLGPTPKSSVNNMTRIELARKRGWELLPGVRFLYRADGPAGNAVGAAAELAVQYVGETGSAFVSGAYTWLDSTSSKEEERVLIQNKVSEARAALGTSFQFKAQTPGQSQVLPQVGAYLSASRNYWHNQFHGDQADSRIRGLQLEAAVYASGHFLGGFSGLISMGILREYGAGPVRFVLSIAPAFGASLKSGDQSSADTKKAIPGGTGSGSAPAPAPAAAPAPAPAPSPSPPAAPPGSEPQPSGVQP